MYHSIFNIVLATSALIETLVYLSIEARAELIIINLPAELVSWTLFRIIIMRYSSTIYSLNGTNDNRAYAIN